MNPMPPHDSGEAHDKTTNAPLLPAHSELQAQAVQIKNIEMQNIDRYLQSIGTQAALIAGFACSVLLCDSLIVFSKDTEQVHQALEILYYTSTTSCLVLEFYCVMNSTLVSVYGPTYALNGPAGSMHIAVACMREERLTILYAFGLGSFAFGVSQICVGFILMPSVTAVLCMLIVLLGFVKVWYSAKRVTSKFHLAFDPKNSAEKLKQVRGDAYLGTKKREAAAKKIDNFSNLTVSKQNEVSLA